MRTGIGVALVALGLSFARPAAAQPLDEIGAGVWLTIPATEGFGIRETLDLHADAFLAPWLRARPGLRLGSAADIQGAALRQTAVPIMGSFYEIAPSISLVAGGEAGPLRLQAGLGLAYNLRFTLTDDSVIGFPIVPTGTTSFGTIKSLGLTYDPGLDAVAEASIPIPLGFRVSVGFGGSLANARLVVQPREDPNLEVSVPKVFFNWSFQLGVRWSLKGPKPTAPAGPPAP